jgi:SHS2 domain-containing protein
VEPFWYPDDGPPADLTVESSGSTIAEAFANMALGAFNAMTPLEGVREQEERIVEVGSEDLGGLLYDFLDQLLFIHDAELLVFSRINVHLDEKAFTLRAECHGEKFDPKRHESGIVVKEVTFHQMKIEKNEKGWHLRVVFDT